MAEDVASQLKVDIHETENILRKAQEDSKKEIQVKNTVKEVKKTEKKEVVKTNTISEPKKAVVDIKKDNK